MSKCSKCGIALKASKTKRFINFFELVWKCDLILDKGLWKGLLCAKCHNAFVQKIESAVKAFKEEPEK